MPATSSEFTVSSRDGRRCVIVTEQNGRYSGRLYVGRGEVATLEAFKTESRQTAEKMANRLCGISAKGKT